MPHTVDRIHAINFSGRRPVVLTFLHRYLPAFRSGGPVRTVANMVAALGDEFDFRIVTADRDEQEKAPFPGIAVNSWNDVGKAQVYYAPPRAIGLRNWGRLLRQTPHDVLYLNSLTDPRFTLLPLLVQSLSRGKRRPVVLAPRGELSPGALALKRRKKAVFLSVAQMIGLYRDVIWHASTAEEASLIRQHFGQEVRCFVAGNLSIGAFLETPETRHAWSGERPLRLVFFSRISRKKNLEFALRVLRGCNRPIQFDVWGIMEDPAYWQECQGLCGVLPAGIRVEYRGEAEPAQVLHILASYDLFFLPTRGENFGHVIAEVLAAGTPVLISDQTPWRDLEREGVGWDLPLEGNEAGFVDAIENAAARWKAEGATWRRQVRAYAERKLGDPEIIEANRRMFCEAIALGKPAR